MKAPALSVCVVARDAERTRMPLMSSLREFADRGGDMVLVDTGSSDQTVAAYKAFGFRVYEEGDRFNITIPADIGEAINTEAASLGDKEIVEPGASLFNFSAARNYAASLAKNDCIINPDADEALTVFDIDAVEEAFQTTSRFQYDFVFSHNPNGSEHLAFITDTRLSNRLDWVWKGHVHETNEPRVPGTRPTMRYVPPTVLKIEHWQVESSTRKHYLAGLAYACHLEPENDRNLHYYGRELLYRGFYNTAIAKLTKHLELSDWDMEKSQSAVFIGDAYMALGEPDRGIDWYHKAFAIAPYRREPFMRLAQYWHKQDRPQQALPYVAAALEIPKPQFYGNTPEYYTHGPYHIQYWAKWWTGDKEGAKAAWTKAMEISPDNEIFKKDAEFFKD